METLKTDIVIIGSGCGLAAAVAAAEKGARVILLEKRRKPGGNTAMARGLMAVESPLQKRLNIEARKEDIFRTAMEYSHWKIDPRIIRTIIDKSGETFQWLEQSGVRFSDVPHFYNNQVPRIYHIPDGYGARMIKMLIQRGNKLNVRFFYQTSAKKILTGKKGKIVGIQAATKNEEIRIKTNSVIIATGGYSGDKELMKKYYPYYSEDMQLNGKPGTGDGLRMAVDAGAATEGLGICMLCGPFFKGSLRVHLVAVESNTVWINQKGDRYIDESNTVYSEVGNALNRQPGRISFTLFDEEIKQYFIEQGLIKGVHRFYPPTTKMKDLNKHLQTESEKGRILISHSLKTVAQWIGADFKALKNSINGYNDCCDRGYDEMFGKDHKYLQPLRTPPYYAIKCNPGYHGTVGGIKINHRMEVLNQQDTPIPGLYAGGNDVGGWTSDTYCYVLSGTALAFAINSGRIAGENAADYISMNP
jgi:fumarate reductase flavoprotein subunit